MIESTL